MVATTEPTPRAPATPVQVLLRVLLGFAGLTLLVGFFLPWLNVGSAPAAEGVAVPLQSVSGFNLALEGELVGTPSKLLWLVPGLGVLLSASAFMGFRWSGQLAVTVAVSLFGYALYVLLQMFVQHTALGLWVVTGGLFIVLLLGVLAWVSGRDRPAVAPSTDAASPPPTPTTTPPPA